MLLSNKAFFIPSADRSLLRVLNSPVGWWISWRHYLHMKDEALSNDGIRIMTFPIPSSLGTHAESLETISTVLISLTKVIREKTFAITDWLHHEIGLDKPGTTLSRPHELDADGLIAAVRKALPKSRKLSAAEVARLKLEHAATVEPARKATREALALERRLSDLVNAAYGLTPDDVALMWATSPPRMPYAPMEQAQ
jgi:hypothetical protein